MFRLSLEWKDFFSHQKYGYWEEQHGVWAHWGRMLWGMSGKGFHLGVECTSRAQALSWGCCQARVPLPWLCFTSMKQSLIFHLPFILFFFPGLILYRKQRLSQAWFCLVHLVLLLIKALLIIDSSFTSVISQSASWLLESPSPTLLVPGRLFQFLTLNTPGKVFSREIWEIFCTFSLAFNKVKSSCLLHRVQYLCTHSL